MVSSVERPRNYPIYTTPIDLDSFIFCNSETDNEIKTELKNKNKTLDSENIFHDSLWHLDFDGSVNKIGAGAGVWITNMENNHAEGYAFRLNFKCTNNIVEYEALILGLHIITNLEGKRVSIMGDSELIVKQINGSYSVYNPRLSQYRETVLDLIKELLECNFSTIPRKQNIQALCCYRKSCY